MKTKLLFQYYRFLGRCARHYLQKHQIFTIGINGSVGKTSCRMIIHQTLEKALPEQRIYTSPKNFNGELGMSLSIFQIENWTPSIFTMIQVGFLVFFKALWGQKAYDIIVLEYGIDRPQEMEFLLSINKPHIGVFTAIDAVHSEQFGNPAEIAREEAKMVKYTKEIAFLNLDDSYAQQLVGTLGIDRLTYQTLGYESQADLHFSDEKLQIELESEHLALTSLQVYLKKQTYQLKTNLLGKPNYGYLTVALVIAQILVLRTKGKELDMQDFLAEPLIFQLQPGRCSLFAGKEGSVLIDSTYNASPLSMRKLIDTAIMIQKSLPKKRKLMLVLGDMRELGDLTEKEHRLLAAYVQQTADFVLLLGTSMREFLADELKKIGFPQEQVQCYDSAAAVGKAVEQFLKSSEEEWILLFKGSQNTIFLEEAVKMLLKNPSDAKLLTRQSEWWLKRKG
ncbi:MAG: hypothetical protein DLD55_01625 [candidate division SR1 bacterium]|nr:MAG: hypothetical protein DLD55_01625 [candidate division SR1 bacterium]